MTTPLPVALAALRHSLRDLEQSNTVEKDGKGDPYVLLTHASRGDTIEISYSEGKYVLHTSKKDQTGMDVKVFHSLADTMKELGAGANILEKIDAHLENTQKRYDAHMQVTTSFNF